MGTPPTEAVLAFSSFPVEDFHGHARRYARRCSSTCHKLLASESGRGEERICQTKKDTKTDRKQGYVWFMHMMLSH